MPYHAVVVAKNKLLMCFQILVSCSWVGLIASYVMDIPQGESGFVIVGMFFSIPIMCLVSQTSIFVVYWLVSKIVAHIKGLKVIGT
ncbi:hypothetical protein tloyanaT_15870 [Thalassotalea loyana]|uniref:DUF2798 domain-containing protein n=1 Tax=Thalassotalea loyana TaxID=280483 RepID=A0ABQ6HB43_9GAMM|nr:hypothetical protein tloyanaT_15870 [Thalassotalea loyana]